MTRREKKTHYETDPQRTIEMFKLPELDEGSAELPDGEIYVYNATLLSNVKFDLDNVMTQPSLVSYVETETSLKLAGGPTIASSEAIVIAEYIHGAWFVTKELVVPDEEE